MFGFVFNRLLNQAQKATQSQNTDESKQADNQGIGSGFTKRDEIDPRFPTKKLKTWGVWVIVATYAVFAVHAIWLIGGMWHSLKNAFGFYTSSNNLIFIVIPAFVLIGLLAFGFIHNAAHRVARGSWLHIGQLFATVAPSLLPIMTIPLAWRDRVTPKSRIALAIALGVGFQALIIYIAVIHISTLNAIAGDFLAFFATLLVTALTGNDEAKDDAILRLRATIGVQAVTAVFYFAIGHVIAFVIDGFMVASLWVPLRFVPLVYYIKAESPEGYKFLCILAGDLSQLRAIFENEDESENGQGERQFAADQPDESEEEEPETDPEPVSDQFTPDEEESEESKDEQIARLKRELSEKSQ